MRKKKGIFIALLLSVLISIQSQAIEPEPSATLIVTTSEQFPMGIYRLEGDLDQYRCSVKKAKPMGTLNNTAWTGGKSSQSLSFVIPASGHRFRFAIPRGLSSKKAEGWGMYELRACVSHVDFLPMPAQTYRATPIISDTGCSMSLVRVEQNGRTTDEISLRVRPQCFLQKMVANTWEQAAKKYYDRHPELYR